MERNLLMESGVFEQEKIPTASDVDALGHVNNIVYVRWVQEVAVAHSDLAGWDLARYRAEGAVFVVRRHEVEYLRPAYDGDRLVLKTWIADWKGASSWRETRVLRGSDAEEVVRARTLWAYVDAVSGRPRRIPKNITDAFRLAPGTSP